MTQEKVFTVLESILNISGKPQVILNTFDYNIPLDAILSDSNGNEWVIKGIDNNVFNKVDSKLKKKITELGAILYIIEPSNSKIKPEVGAQLTLR